MSRATFGMLVLVVLAVAGCGSSKKFANKPRPAVPVNLTVYVNNRSVSVSPDSVGAGQVVFYVTNQSDKAQSITIHPSGNASQSLANTGPINPQGTARVTVDFNRPGSYQVATANGGSDAAQASGSAIQPAALRITKGRPSSTNQLLQP
jgi:hypothetical protein